MIVFSNPSFIIKFPKQLNATSEMLYDGSLCPLSREREKCQRLYERTCDKRPTLSYVHCCHLTGNDKSHISYENKMRGTKSGGVRYKFGRENATKLPKEANQKERNFEERLSEERERRRRSSADANEYESRTCYKLRYAMLILDS